MTPSATRPLAFLGSPSASLLQALSEVAHEALPGAVKPLLFGPEARATVANGAPCVALVDVDDPAAEDEAIALRRDPAHATTPLIGIAADANEVAFSTSYGFGGDDVIPAREVRKLLPRARVLQSSSTSMVAPQRRGVAIVASDDRKRRVTVGRLLHGAGYSIEFAGDATEASTIAQKFSAKLVVLDSGVDAVGTLAQIKRARLGGLTANWVLVVPPRHIAQLSPLVDPLPYVALGDAFAPPENVLFVANELARGGGTEGRGSARLLFGATVHFRLAGRDEDDIGFSYNVSQTGLYVRTLVAPPAKSVVWVELQPPRCDRRVRLEGVVQWRRPFGPNDQATVPTGFGFEITDGSKADRERYVEGYKALYASTFGS
jgi:hypothetical protein